MSSASSPNAASGAAPSAESGVRHIVGLSGGKDSTALALRLQELHPEREFEFLCTPTGDELPEMLAHWEKLECLLGKPLTRVTNGTLSGWIEEWDKLPSWRMRWCTQVLKIMPTVAFLKRNAPAVLYVGLRADEPPEARRGLQIDFAGVSVEFPLREWRWGLAEVRSYLRARGVSIPRRTDCARCYGQRLGEWEDLYHRHPEIYADAASQEEATGHTFRSPGRDSRPAALKDLARTFSQGPLPMLGDPTDDEGEVSACRVCRL